MEPIIVEVRLAPDTAALLKNFAPKANAINPQLPPQSPAEQAARMRMQPPPVPMPQQPAPTYAPQQYRPQPGPTPATPYATCIAPVVPIRNPQLTPPVNPTPPTGTPPVRTASPAGQSTVQPAAVPSNPAPVAGAPTYEQDQLARATATLADAGKMQQIQQLFQQFQIQQLTQLPKERYGEYATALRQLGVRI